LLDSFTHGAVGSLIADNIEANADLIGLRNAAFTWSIEDQNLDSSTRRFTLTVDKELLFKRGKINLIVGPTGSGKTSLLMALLGMIFIDFR
jgi:ABC-type transport system involved in cytochrome bd biosynthesis fused ATPase/permease subunit